MEEPTLSETKCTSLSAFSFEEGNIYIFVGAGGLTSVFVRNRQVFYDFDPRMVLRNEA